MLAGPGSGKTTVIIQRILHLMEGHGVNPSSILAITFTKAAAMELKGRFLNACQNSKEREQGAEASVSFGTFHSVFYQILQNYFRYKELSFITQTEKEKWIYYLCEKNSNRILQEMDTEEIFRTFSMWKNGMLIRKEEVLQKMLEELYWQYNRLLKEEERLDYDDILCQCCELLKNKPDVCRFWEERFEYILIDEFQDISPIQYEIISLLTKSHQNLFAVGDDDQSIYSFRGANPSIAREFLSDYHAKKIVLDRNYRSTQEIVDASLKVISQNKNRIEKELMSVHKSEDKLSFEVIGFENALKQYEYVKLRLSENKEFLTERAILCRTNRECKQIAEWLAKLGVTCQLKEKKKRLGEHPLVKVTIAYIKWILGDDSRQNFLLFMNCPKRGLLRSWIKETVWQEDLLHYAHSMKEESEQISKLFQQRSIMKEWKPELMIRYLLFPMGVQSYFEKQGVTDVEQVSEYLLKSAKECTDIHVWLESMELEYMEERKEEEGLRIMTVHASKGLEYDEVWLLNCNEGVFPKGKHLSKEELEEERRIFYVAMTRAKKKLHLCYLKGTSDNPMECSRFLKIFC